VYLQVFTNVYQQWFPNGDASSFAGFMFEAFDENRVSSFSSVILSVWLFYLGLLRPLILQRVSIA